MGDEIWQLFRKFHRLFVSFLLVTSTFSPIVGPFNLTRFCVEFIMNVSVRLEHEISIKPVVVNFDKLKYDISF